MKKVAVIHRLEDRTAQTRCDEGFLHLRRWTLQTEFDDGSRSRPYRCDMIERPGTDAVALVLWRRRADGRVEVLLRECTRPTIYFRRDQALQVPDGREYRHLLELVAGILEPEDLGDAGILERAAAEAHEEVGYRIPVAEVHRLGGGYFSCPGILPEKVYLCAAEVRDHERGDAAGDGSAMEEGGSAHWLELNEAIRQCVRGEIEDAKTELGLRRLADELGRPGPLPT